MTKRILSLILCLAMCLSMIPTAAFAAEVADDDFGSEEVLTEAADIVFAEEEALPEAEEAPAETPEVPDVLETEDDIPEETPEAVTEEEPAGEEPVQELPEEETLSALQQAIRGHGFAYVIAQDDSPVYDSADCRNALGTVSGWVLTEDADSADSVAATFALEDGTILRGFMRQNRLDASRAVFAAAELTLGTAAAEALAGDGVVPVAAFTPKAEAPAAEPAQTPEEPADAEEENEATEAPEETVEEIPEETEEEVLLIADGMEAALAEAGEYTPNIHYDPETDCIVWNNWVPDEGRSIKKVYLDAAPVGHAEKGSSAMETKETTTEVSLPGIVLIENFLKGDPRLYIDRQTNDLVIDGIIPVTVTYTYSYSDDYGRTITDAETLKGNVEIHRTFIEEYPGKVNNIRLTEKNNGEWELSWDPAGTADQRAKNLIRYYVQISCDAEGTLMWDFTENKLVSPTSGTHFTQDTDSTSITLPNFYTAFKNIPYNWTQKIKVRIFAKVYGSDLKIPSELMSEWYTDFTEDGFHHQITKWDTGTTEIKWGDFNSPQRFVVSWNLDSTTDFLWGLEHHVNNRNHRLFLALYKTVDESRPDVTDYIYRVPLTIDRFLSGSADLTDVVLQNGPGVYVAAVVETYDNNDYYDMWYYASEPRSYSPGIRMTVTDPVGLQPDGVYKTYTNNSVTVGYGMSYGQELEDITGRDSFYWENYINWSDVNANEYRYQSVFNTAHASKQLMFREPGRYMVQFRSVLLPEQNAQYSLGEIEKEIYILVQERQTGNSAEITLNDTLYPGLTVLTGLDSKFNVTGEHIGSFKVSSWAVNGASAGDKMITLNAADKVQANIVIYPEKGYKLPYGNFTVSFNGETYKASVFPDRDGASVTLPIPVSCRHAGNLYLDSESHWYVCTKCGETYNHGEHDWKFDRTEAGVETQKCSVCQQIQKVNNGKTMPTSVSFEKPILFDGEYLSSVTIADADSHIVKGYDSHWTAHNDEAFIYGSQIEAGTIYDLHLKLALNDDYYVEDDRQTLGSIFKVYGMSLVSGEISGNLISLTYQERAVNRSYAAITLPVINDGTSLKTALESIVIDTDIKEVNIALGETGYDPVGDTGMYLELGSDGIIRARNGMDLNQAAENGKSYELKIYLWTALSKGYLGNEDIALNSSGNADKFFIMDASVNDCKMNRIVQASYSVGQGCDHVMEEFRENEIPVQCETDGSYDRVMKCAVCGLEVSRQHITVPAEGHVYDNDDDPICNVCGTKRNLGISLPDGLYCADIPDQLYTGKAIKPELQVYYDGRLLTLGKDYTVKYGSKNTNVADKTAVNSKGKSIAPSVTITGKGNYKGTKTVYFSIVPADLSYAPVSDIVAAKTGKPIKIAQTVYYNGKKLKAGKDYVISTTTDRSGAITTADTSGYLYVVGIGNYTGSSSFSFTVTTDVLAGKVTITKIPNQTYTGSDIKPAVEIKYNKQVVTDKFNVSYSSNKAVGTAAVTIEAKSGSGFAGEKSATFKIIGRSISSAKLGLDGKGTLPSVTYYPGQKAMVDIDASCGLYLGDKKLSLNSGDYGAVYTNNIKAGTAKITVSGNASNGYTGSKTVKFKILPYDAGKDEYGRLTINGGAPVSVPYEKGGVKPKLVIKDGSAILAEGKDYTLSYANFAASAAANAAKAPTITIKFKGNYSGTRNVTYTITNKALSACTVTLDGMAVSTKTNGWKQTKLTITDTNGKKLAAGTDYDKNIRYYSDAACRNEITAATLPADTIVYVKVVGIKNYAASTAVGSYRISKVKLSSAKASIAAQVYSGEPICPKADEIKVTVGSGKNLKTLVPGVDYEVVPGSYAKNVNIGKASVTIRGLGDYTGTKVVSYTIAKRGFVWWLDLLNL